jgi:allantoinase
VSASEFFLSSRRVATPDGVGPASIHVRAGRIVAVSRGEAAAAAMANVPVVDVGDHALLPGLVDTHVHINEPGRTEWEGFASATAAAASGGVTTLVDMPLNSIPPTTSTGAFGRKLEAAAGRCRVHVGFWGGLVPSSASEIAHLASAGVFGFKCFLVDSGVPEFAPIAEMELQAAMREIARLDALLIVHAEWPDSIAATWPGRPEAYAGYLGSRPHASENEAVRRVVRLCRATGARVHILHLSSAEALEPLERARAEGLPVTAETCPHYLALDAEEIPDGATEFKCAPPIRERENRERLWQGLGSGAIDMVVSDHSPSPPELKRRDTGNFARAWGGISSLGLALPVVWTEARRRGHSLSDVARWMSLAPARLARLESCKGAIAPGQDADLVVFDPEAEWTVVPEDLRHRHKLSPYAGRRLSGVVEATYLKGEKIWENGRDIGGPAGELLLSAGGA